MKKIFFMIVLLFTAILPLIFSSCTKQNNKETTNNWTKESSNNDISQTDDGENNMKKIYSSNNQFSIFENKLPDYDTNRLDEVNIIINGNEWIINDKRFVSQVTTSFTVGNISRWKVDLSCMIPCAKNSDIILFSVDGNDDNNVIIALYSNCIFFLTGNDILEPTQYEISDFSIEYYADDSLTVINTDIEALWKSHLKNKKENNINRVGSEDPFPSIRLRLKSDPELFYAFPYIEINGEYYTPEPFET